MKIDWHGEITSVQPRFRLMRSFDQRHHTYLGYALRSVHDQRNAQQKRYRFETFCYGPESCSLYKPGPTRKVPGRRGMTYEEED